MKKKRTNREAEHAKKLRRRLAIKRAQKEGQKTDEAVKADPTICQHDTDGDGNCGKAACPVCNPENQPSRPMTVENAPITEKQRRRHFPTFQTEELYQPDGRWQLYGCQDCGHRWAMRLIHKGVTPFTMTCPECNAVAHSNGQSDDDRRPDGYAAGAAEWRMLDAAEMTFFSKRDPAYYDHLQRGGLAAVHPGKRVDAATTKNRPATSIKSQIPGRNHDCPCGSGKKYKRCCIGLPRAEQLERFEAAADLPPDPATIKALPDAKQLHREKTEGLKEQAANTSAAGRVFPDFSELPDFTAAPGDEVVQLCYFRCRDCSKVTRAEDDGSAPEWIRCHYCRGKAYPTNPNTGPAIAPDNSGA